MSDPRRAQIFGTAADTYDATRPDYPSAVIDVIVADGPATAVDAGCGTGKAARLVMARGVAVLGVEPDPRMAAVARRHGVDVVVSTFEDWTPTPRDCVFSAQAWHWVDPRRGAERAAAALAPGGRWTAVWNREDDPTLTDVLVGAYERWAPNLVDERRGAWSREAVLVDGTRQGLDATGAFGVLVRHDVAWTERLTVGRLVDRLSTTSGHQMLPAATAAELLDHVATELGGRDHVVTIEQSTLVLTAGRR